MNIDKQRIDAVRMLIDAVRMLQALGYTYRDGEWLLTGGAPRLLTAEADAMHGVLMRRANVLAGCTDESDEEAELKAIVDAIEAYEAKRWPLGKGPNVPGGKG